MEYGSFKRRDRNPRDGGDRSFNRDRDRYRDGGHQRPYRGDRDGRGDQERDIEESVFSKKVHAGRRRTYFLDVKKTKQEDYFLTITESTRREDGGYRRHKIFLYKEDFNRFIASLQEVVNHVKTELMPDFDYEEFDRRQAEWEAQNRDSEETDEETSATGRFQRPREEDERHEEEEDEHRTRRPKEEDDMSW